ncbi:MAG: flagellar basal body rod protein FlgB [Acidobacteria bacterium]|nr:flagellar basal body rod protein FlgB [Acidobacteriota bacterium]
MPDYSDTAITDALRRQMTLAAARQVVAASNLANVDTPGYRAREVDFSEALTRHVSDGVVLAKTQPGHLDDPNARASASDVRTREVAGLDARRDGNTVQIDRELLSMGSAAGDFARAQTVLAAKFRLLRYAINEAK